MSQNKFALPDHFGKRVVMCVAGVMLCAVAVGFFRCSLFGVDPFQCCAMGTWGRFGTVLSYGTFYTLLNLVILIVDLILDRHNIGLGTFINMFLTGYVVDFSASMLERAVPDPGLATRIGFLAFAIVLMCFASSLYMTADMGVSTYDAVPIWISGHYHRQFRIVRIITDIVCVAIGTACVLAGAVDGQMPGVGTIVTALFMGPLIDWFNRKFSRPLLER